MLPRVNGEKLEVIQHPIINGLQKMAVYRTRSMFYVIGTNILQSKFRILKVDRTVPFDLVLTDDKVEYSSTEIRKIISMLNDGNKSSTGAARFVSAFGILGFVRFLEGYYMILITKREKVAVIGHHSIYKIADTSIICIPHESVRIPHEEEHKYVKSFNSIDLTGNFYFSYTYDLSNSLQYNMAPFRNIRQHIQDNPEETFMNPDLKRKKAQPIHNNTQVHVACKTAPNWKFIWNYFLLKDLIDQVHDTWILPVTHGFINQISIVTSAKTVHLAVLARRSAKYAGTRFLKRGANSDGHVANEVESEQIVYDTDVLSLHEGNFTSFVQIRGSIPTHWSHLGTRPKPPIVLDFADIYAKTAGKHFNNLFKRFGSPVIVLNLVKQQKDGYRTKECILSDEYARIINQLNLTIPKTHHIQHISLDMANIKKSKNEDVMEHLRKAAYEAVLKTGIFQTSADPYAYYLNPRSNYNISENTSSNTDKKSSSEKSCEYSPKGKNQTGVLRVNCVDCLDRTNTAMYAVAMCAVGFQLKALGAVEVPIVENGSECAKMLQTLYDEHGDSLAHQYAGSNLVHRIDSYQQTSGWTDQGRDLMESGLRFYKNTYEDHEKQIAINLFLGVERPARLTISEADLSKEVAGKIDKNFQELRKSSASWLDSDILMNLPLPYEQLFKTPSFAFLVNRGDSMINMFNDFYRCNEYTSFFMCFHFNIEQSSRNTTVDQNVFSLPLTQKKYYEDAMLFSKNSETALLEKNRNGNINLNYRVNTQSIASPSFTEEDTITKDDLKLDSFFKTSEIEYIFHNSVPDQSVQLYKRYAKMSDQCCVKPTEIQTVDFNTCLDASNPEYFLKPNTRAYDQPTLAVSENSKKLYEDYLNPSGFKIPNQDEIAQYYKTVLLA